MNSRSAIRNLTILAAVLASAACAANGNGSGSGSGIPTPFIEQQTRSNLRSNGLSAIPIVSPGPAVPACTPSPPGTPWGHSKCGAIANGSVKGLPGNTPLSAIPGYHASELQAAYALPSATAGKGQTVTIIVAYDNPHLQSDLQQYRKTMGLPNCNNCLKKLSFGHAKPTFAGSWGQEASVDVEMISAVCPNCNIDVVESPDDTVANLAFAMQSAIRSGARVIAASFAAPESSVPAQYDAMLSAPGVAIVAGSGDSGMGVNWPANSPNVTAVSGTSLLMIPSLPRGYSEVPWSNSGYGCSAVEPKPAWQSNVPCTTRGVADISADGDPNTGVAIYTSAAKGPSGWYVYGGTSVATQIVAGIYGLAGGQSPVNGASGLYANASSLNQINGLSYQMQGGLGTPNGLAGF